MSRSLFRSNGIANALNLHWQLTELQPTEILMDSSSVKKMPPPLETEAGNKYIKLEIH